MWISSFQRAQSLPKEIEEGNVQLFEDNDLDTLVDMDFIISKGSEFDLDEETCSHVIDEDDYELDVENKSDEDVVPLVRLVNIKMGKLRK